MCLDHQEENTKDMLKENNRKIQDYYKYLMYEKPLTDQTKDLTSIKKSRKYEDRVHRIHEKNERLESWKG